MGAILDSNFFFIGMFLFLSIFVNGNAMNPSIDSECIDISSRRVRVSLISDARPERIVQKNWSVVHDFIGTESFAGKAKVWSKLHVPPCPDKENSEEERGLILTHKEALHDFYLNSKPCDVLVVFEHGVFPAHPDIRTSVMDAMMEMTADILWLGYCYRKKDGHPIQTNYPPSCSHAYGVTRGGALKLHQLVNSCDVREGNVLKLGLQMQELALSEKISWGYRATEDPVCLHILINNLIHLDYIESRDYFQMDSSLRRNLTIVLRKVLTALLHTSTDVRAYGIFINANGGPLVAWTIFSILDWTSKM